jgi:hypothetical protein
MSFLRYSTIFFLSLLLPNVHSTCYLPNGEISYQNATDGACGNTSGDMCCGINTSSNPDTCRTDGTCKDGENNLWRVTCTDPKWGPGCLNLCTSGFIDDFINHTNKQIDLSTITVLLTVCPDNSYCCGPLNTDCCNQNQGYWVKDLVVYPHSLNPFIITTGSSSATGSSVSSTSSTTTSGSSSSSTLSTNFVTSTLESSVSSAIAFQTATLSGSVVTYYSLPTSQADNSHSSSPTKVLTVGLGAGLGGLALVGVAAFSFLCLRRRRDQHNNGWSQVGMPYLEGTRLGDVILPHYEKTVISVAENVELGDVPARELAAPDAYYNYALDRKQRHSVRIQEMGTGSVVNN